MGPLGALILVASTIGWGETVLLDFYSDACPPCRAMDPIVRQLASEGHPIRKVNVQRERELAARFGVTGIPCFVMLVGGREVDRVVGATSAGRLQQMLAMSRSAGPQPAPSLTPIGVSPDAARIASGSRSPQAIPLPAEVSNQTFSAVATPSPSAVASPSLPAAATPSQQSDTSHGGATEPAAAEKARFEADLIACTVRLRIEDARGHSYGSGTLVDARGGEALILTCGHLFRDSQGKGRIDVDLFGERPVEGMPGELIHFDLEKDLALLRIRVSGPVRTARIAPPGYRVAKGTRVVNVGCNNGDPPSVRYAHVTALDKFLGPANIEVSGLPVQGRSGGGLFSADGLVIGVCNAAVPTDNEGLYAAIDSIHAELDQVNLAFVYRDAPQVATSDATKSAAESQAASPAPNRSPSTTAVAASDPPSMPRTMPPPAELVQLTDAPGPRGGADSPRADIAAESAGQTLTADEQAALEEIQRRKDEGAEVILIIRSASDPRRKSEVIMLDRVSPAFLKQLTSDSSPPRPDRAPPAPLAGRNSIDRSASLPASSETLPSASRSRGARDPGSPSEPSWEWSPRWLASDYHGS